MVQIIVYTGAIMMLFLFVLMLVGRDASDSLIETLRGQRVAAIAARPRASPGWSAPALYRALGGRDRGRAGRRPTPTATCRASPALLFTKYVFAFEVTSALLITAAVGAMVLAHVERRKDEKIDQVGRMQARFAPGNYPGPKPGPGVFATSDSVATPARLPDGTPAERSISDDPARRAS